MEKLSVPKSIQMENLLSDTVVTRQIARSFDSIDKVLFQIGLDVATPENAPSLGHDILAIKRIRDMLLLFSSRGQVLLKEDDKQQNK